MNAVLVAVLIPPGAGLFIAFEVDPTGNVHECEVWPTCELFAYVKPFVDSGYRMKRQPGRTFLYAEGVTDSAYDALARYMDENEDRIVGLFVPEEVQA